MQILLFSLKQNGHFFTHPKRILFLIISSVILASFFMIEMKDALATEGINQTINFQGRVANSNGTNVANGNYNFVFRLYKVSSAGTAQWTETWNSGTSQVTVTDGIFRVALGTHSSLSSLDFNDDAWYLSVEFNGDGEMDPRIRFASVPYALNAKTVAGLTVTDTTGTFTLLDGKTFTVNNTLGLSGTDGTTFTFPTASGTVVTLDATQALTNKTIGSTGLSFSGASADVFTVSNEDFTVEPNGTGDIILTSNYDSAVLVGSSANTPAVLSVSGGIGNNAAFIVDQRNSGNIFTASASGITKFFIDNNGNASSSAGFTINALGALQSTNNQLLTIGGDTTGNIILQPLNGSGRVGIGTANPGRTLEIASSGTTAYQKFNPTTNDDWTIGADENGFVVFNDTDNAYSMQIHQDGDAYFANNVMIGDLAVSPSRPLHVYGATDGIDVCQRLQNAGTGGDSFDICVGNTGSTFGDAIGFWSPTNTQALMTLEAGGKVGIGTLTPTSQFHLTRSTSLATTGKALAIFDQLENQDIFTASSSGVSKFTITNAGGIKLGSSEGTGGNCLLSGGAGGASTWGSCGSGGSSNWVLNSSTGTLSPINNTLDFLWGGTASTSAKFAILNTVGANSPTASLSAGADGGLYITANGTLTTTAVQNITIGGATAGDITLNARNNAGKVTVSGAPTAAATTSLLQIGSTAISGGNANGTYLGINAASGYTGDLFAVQKNSVTQLAIDNTGSIYFIPGNGSNSDCYTWGGNCIGRGAVSSAFDLTLQTGNSSDITLDSHSGIINLQSNGGSSNNIILNAGSGFIQTGIAGTLQGSYRLSGATSGTITLTSNATAGTYQLTLPNSDGDAGQALTSDGSGVLSWATYASGINYFNQTLGMLHPINSTLDFAIGGTSTTSAKFAVLGVASDSPIASLSASTGYGLSLGYNGVIQTTRNQTLTLGGDKTGDIVLSPINGAGKVTVNGTLDAATGGSATFLVAADDSPARMKAQADYVADGTADEVQIQAAIDALPSTGGEIQLAQGTYNLAATVSITANKRIKLTGYGALLRPAASVAAITVSQGISNAQGAILEGMTIDGQSNAGSKGILLEDTNNPAIYNVRIINAATGIHINSENTNEFVEGLAIEDVLVRDCVAGGTGISLTTNAGTGSFAQHQWRTVKIANCDTGINLAYPSQFYRSYIENATIWIETDQTAVVIDGDTLLSRMEINVEGATASTGNTAISIGSNATNTEHLDFFYTSTGTIATTLSNVSTKEFTYKKNRNWFTSGDMRALRLFEHGDSEERLAFLTSFAQGGGILFGAGGASAADVNLFRSGANSLMTDDSFTIGERLIMEYPGSDPGINTSNEGLQSAALGNLDINARGSMRIFMDSNSNSSDNFRIFADGSSKEVLRLEETGGKALLSINNFWSSQNIFTASTSGVTKFNLTSDGSIQLAADQTIDTITSGTLGIGTVNATTLTLGRSGQGITLPGFTGGGSGCSALETNGSGVISCGTDDSGSGGSSNWVLNSSTGTLSPINNTLDLLIGGTATTSAKFSILGVAAGTNPSASVSATTGANDGKGIALFGNSSIQTFRNNTLTLGGDTTGNISLMPSNGNGNVGINTASPSHFFEIVSSGASRNALQVNHTFANGTGLGTGTYRPFNLAVSYTSTDLAATTNSWQGIRSELNYGSGGVAAMGTVHGFTSDVVVSGNGSASNEHSPVVMSMRYDIGTGYTQTTGPTGRAWLTDFNLHGPIAVQPDLLNGISVFMNNHYNGSPSSAPSGGLWIQTEKGDGGGRDALHEAANTYAIDVGIGIVGVSNNGADANGFNKAIQIGGSGGGWGVAASRIGTGIDLRDFIDYGIYIHDRHANAASNAPAIAIASGAGGVGIGTLTPGTILLDVNSASTLDPIARFGGGTNNGHSLELYAENAKFKPFVTGVNGGFLTNALENDSGIIFADSGNFHVGTQGNSNSWLYIKNDGRTGVGTTTPHGVLHVKGGSQGVLAALIAEQAIASGDIFSASSSGTAKFTITNSGSIALGAALDEGSSGECLKSQGTGVIAQWDTCGGGSQTPWTSDIDGDNFSLLDMGTNITSRNGLTVGTAASGNLTLTANGTGDVLVTGDADTNLQVSFSAAPGVDMAVISNSAQGTTTDGVNGLRVDFETAAVAGARTNAGLEINVTSGATEAGDTLYGVNIENITGQTGVESGIRIGTGWDRGLVIESGGSTNSGLVYSGAGRPTKTVTLSPEYSGAVVTAYYGAGTDTNITGSLTSDTDTTQGTSIRNYYQWERTTDATQHFYTVAVRVTLPADFDAWATSNALTVSYRTESATNTVSDLDVRVFNENNATVVASSADNASTSWTTVAIDDSTLDDGASSEWDAAGETSVIYLRMGSASSNYVQIGDIQLNYLAKF